MDYDIKESVVYYNCPECSKDLMSSMNDAGLRGGCTSCEASFIIPGEKEKTDIDNERIILFSFILYKYGVPFSEACGISPGNFFDISLASRHVIDYAKRKIKSKDPNSNNLLKFIDEMEFFKDVILLTYKKISSIKL